MDRIQDTEEPVSPFIIEVLCCIGSAVSCIAPEPEQPFDTSQPRGQF